MKFEVFGNEKKIAKTHTADKLIFGFDRMLIIINNNKYSNRAIAMKIFFFFHWIYFGRQIQT